MTYRLLYFASMADAAGIAEESRASAASTPDALYAEVAAAHGFAIAREHEAAARLAIEAMADLELWLVGVPLEHHARQRVEVELRRRVHG